MNNIFNRADAVPTNVPSVDPTYKFEGARAVDKYKKFFDDRKNIETKEKQMTDIIGQKPEKTATKDAKTEWNQKKIIFDNIDSRIIPRSIIDHKVTSNIDLKNKKIPLELFIKEDESSKLSNFYSSPLYAMNVVYNNFSKILGNEKANMLLKHIEIKSVEYIISVEEYGISGYQIQQYLLSDEDTYIDGAIYSDLDQINQKKIIQNIQLENVQIEIGKNRIYKWGDNFTLNNTLNGNNVSVQWCGKKATKVKNDALMKDNIVIDAYGKPGIVNFYYFGLPLKHRILIKYDVSLSEFINLPALFWENDVSQPLITTTYIDYILDNIFSPSILLSMDINKITYIKAVYPQTSLVVSPNSEFAKRLNILHDNIQPLIGSSENKIIIKELSGYLNLFKKCLDFAKDIKTSYLKGSSSSMSIKLTEFYDRRFIKKNKNSTTNAKYTDYTGYVEYNEELSKKLSLIQGVNSKIITFISALKDITVQKKKKGTAKNPIDEKLDPITRNYKNFSVKEIIDDIEPYLEFLYKDKDEWGYIPIKTWVKNAIEHEKLNIGEDDAVVNRYDNINILKSAMELKRKLIDSKKKVLSDTITKKILGDGGIEINKKFIEEINEYNILTGKEKKVKDLTKKLNSGVVSKHEYKQIENSVINNNDNDNAVHDINKHIEYNNNEEENKQNNEENEENEEEVNTNSRVISEQIALQNSINNIPNDRSNNKIYIEGEDVINPYSHEYNGKRYLGLASYIEGKKDLFMFTYNLAIKLGHNKQIYGEHLQILYNLKIIDTIYNIIFEILFRDGSTGYLLFEDYIKLLLYPMTMETIIAFYNRLTEHIQGIPKMDIDDDDDEINYNGDSNNNINLDDLIKQPKVSVEMAVKENDGFSLQLGRKRRNANEYENLETDADSNTKFYIKKKNELDKIDEKLDEDSLDLIEMDYSYSKGWEKRYMDEDKKLTKGQYNDLLKLKSYPDRFKNLFKSYIKSNEVNRKAARENPLKNQKVKNPMKKNLNKSNK